MINTLVKPDLKQIEVSSKIKLIAVVGQSACGKTYLSRKWAGEKNYHLIVSSTTRPPREKEINGKDYWFLTEEEFAASEFLESAEFRKWHYGTRWTNLDFEKTNIGVFNPSGIYQLWELQDKIDLTIIYVLADEDVRLARSLGRENNPDITEINRRRKTDEKDFAKFENWIINKPIFYYINN